MNLVVDLSEFTDILNDVYVPLLEDKHRYLALYGGSGSGKSHFACQKLLYRTIAEEGHRFLVMRKVARTLRTSVFQLFLDYIYGWKLYDLFHINRSDMSLKFKPNGNSILFAGIDDPEKMKSIERITGMWIEEATELFLRDFDELDRRLRGTFDFYKQIILTFNPILDQNWACQNFLIAPKRPNSVKPVHTTYKDNRYILDDPEYIDLLESYTGNARQVYTLGQPGKLEHAVYQNWDIVDEFPETDREVCGLDFGYINPNALIRTVLDENDLYIDELIYKRKQTIPDLKKDMIDLGLEDTVIIADSEKPEAIKELQRAGFRKLMGCKKGKGSVEEGIRQVQRYRLHVTRRSTNIIKEIQTYQRQMDKNGNVLEAVEKSNDHAMDCLRYIVYTYYSRGKRIKIGVNV